MRTLGGWRGSGRPGEPVRRAPGAADRVPRDDIEPLRLRVEALAWLAVWELARRVPEPVAFAAADVLARAAARVLSGGHLRANLARVVAPDQLDATVAKAWRSYARYWVEAFRAADLDPVDLDARTTVAGLEHVDRALERGRGAVILLAHHGSWDVVAQWGESHGYHLAVVAEVVRPRRLFDRFVRLREQIGLDVVPVPRGKAGAAVLAPLVRTLRDNHLVGLLAERDLSGTAPLTPFFDGVIRLPRGPVALAQRVGAAVLPATMLQRPGRRWHLQVLPEVAVQGLPDAEAAQRVAAGLEDIIRLDPAQWHAFSRVFAEVGRDTAGTGGAG